MLYTPRNVQQKTSSKGTNYIVADFEDVNGQVTENVSTFDPVKEGVSIDGQIIQNGQYLNFKTQAKVVMGGKTGQIEKVMDKKNESIAHFQDAKEKSIQHAGAITNATNLLVAMLGTPLLGGMSEEKHVKDKLRELIIFYKNLYQNPDSINPAASDEPPF